MIVLNLCCDSEHTFEGWFASASTYEDQLARGLVSCPVCDSLKISRRPTAPYVIAGTSPPAPAPKPHSHATAPSADAVATAIALLRQAGRDSEDVGEQFSDEARRIHYGESEARSIKGQATREDVSALLDEGIMVLPLPAEDSDVH